MKNDDRDIYAAVHTISHFL